MSKKSGSDLVREIDKEASSLKLRLAELKWEQKRAWKRLKEIEAEAHALSKERGFLKVDVGLHEAGKLIGQRAERGTVRLIADVSQGRRRIRLQVLSDSKNLLRYAIGKGGVYKDVWTLTGFQNVQAVVAATWQYLPESTKADAKTALLHWHKLGKGKIEVKAESPTY